MTTEEDQWTSQTGANIEEVYGPPDPPLGRPGHFPFTRHIYETGYRDRPWSPSLYSGFGTPEEANRRFRFLIEEGNGRANIATDLPTQIGLDSDDEQAAGEVGRVGVAIDSLADFELMFEGVPLERTPVSLNVNTVAPIFLAMLVAVARSQQVDLSDVRGTLANDILHEYIARGTWRYPTGPSLRLMADVVEFAADNMPHYYPLNIRSILLHEAGAHPGQEIGITFAIACRYIDELVDRGIPVERFARRMSFFFGASERFLEEAAKFRAARRLWARLLSSRYGVTDEACMKLRITSVAPCGSHFTSVDPQLNLVRGTLGVLSGALGGVQAMLGTTIDEAFSIPTEETQRLALRTQQIVALESDVCATVDPLGGSYFIEAMTDEIEKSAVEEMDRYGGPEGIVDVISQGIPQADLANRAYEIEREYASGRRSKVGVNVHTTDEEPTLQLQEFNLDLYKSRSEHLLELRQRRDSRAADVALAHVTETARTGDNIILPIVDALIAEATIGEISHAMDDVFGTFQQPTNL